MDTMNGGPPRTRSDHILQTTKQYRGHGSNGKVPVKNEIRANDHVTPHKRLKVRDSRELGNTVHSAISLDDTQILDDSADELQLSPRSVERKSIRQHRSHTPIDGSTQTKITGRDRLDPAETSNLARFSPEDEGQFTKISARQRKAEKDNILGSSSPAPPKQTPVGTIPSPYFTKAGTSTAEGGALKRNRNEVPAQESPDVLHNDTSPRVSRPEFQPRATVSELRTRDLGTMIMGRSSNAAINRPARSKKTGKEPVAFHLKEFVYRNVDDTSNYIVEIDTEKSEISIDTVDKMLGDEPVYLPRPVRKIVHIYHGNDLVVLKFSRNGPREEKMGFRFDSEKKAVEFVKLLQDLDTGLKVTWKDL